MPTVTLMAIITGDMTHELVPFDEIPSKSHSFFVTFAVVVKPTMSCRQLRMFLRHTLTTGESLAALVTLSNVSSITNFLSANSHISVGDFINTCITSDGNDAMITLL